MTIDRADRMARFAAGARRVILRAAATGVLVAAGWLLAVLFGMLTAAPAAADSTAATGAAAETGSQASEAGSLDETASQAHRSLTSPVTASVNAEAMAGRTVDGLNSQQDPGLPSPSSAGKILDTNGLVPNGGGSGPFGSVAGGRREVRFRPAARGRSRTSGASASPVVRTAADDPSFSPD
ncbi:hypothetical protein [Nonomuraea salmonea]|uniref:hypothetical protein n=1 Tax=Nonomuraea salmonea TaxID=46181 RepID=UPI0031E50A77